VVHPGLERPAARRPRPRHRRDIRTHAKDRKVAAWLENTAEAFEEIGEIDLAIDWAKQATDFDRGHQSLKAAGKSWPDYRDEVVTTLAASPRDAVLFALLTLKDPEFAWNLAHSLALDSDHTWSELVKAYEKVDPIATLPIHQRLVENELVEAGAQHYRLAARRLAKMRKLSAGSDKLAEVHDLIAELRETHRRRPRLQQEFDRAGLP
jgi:uncharacterized Zn finger protein